MFIAHTTTRRPRSPGSESCSRAAGTGRQGPASQPCPRPDLGPAMCSFPACRPGDPAASQQARGPGTGATGLDESLEAWGGSGVTPLPAPAGPLPGPRGFRQELESSTAPPAVARTLSPCPVAVAGGRGTAPPRALEPPWALLAASWTLGLGQGSEWTLPSSLPWALEGSSCVAAWGGAAPGLGHHRSPAMVPMRWEPGPWSPGVGRGVSGLPASRSCVVPRPVQSALSLLHPLPSSPCLRKGRGPSGGRECGRRP